MTTTPTTWNPMLPPGVTAYAIRCYLDYLDTADFAGLGAVAKACGFVWQMGTAWWIDDNGPEYNGACQCVVYGFTRDTVAGDEPFHEGDEWRSSPGVTEPTAALREALRLALEYVSRRFEDVEEDEDG